MTLNETDKKIEKIKTKIKFYEEKKQLAFERTQPKGMNFDGVQIKSFGDGNMLDNYVIELEKYDIKIKHLEEDLFVLEKYKQGLLKIIGEFNEIEHKIYSLRNDKEYEKNHGRCRTWEQIGRLVYLSEDRARHIYYDLIKR